MTRTAIVTGASGFVGGHICARFLADGWDVVGLSRSGNVPVGVRPVFVAPSTGERTLARAFAGVDAIVHAAGRAHVMRETMGDPLAEYREVNVTLTRTIARAAATAEVPVVLFISSVAAVANVATERVGDSDPPLPDTPYGVSKLEAEDALEAAAHAATRTVVLRPPLLYGEGMKGNPLLLFRYIARGVPLPVAWPDVSRAMIYVGDFAEAVLLAVTHENVAGRFFVSDGSALGVAAFARAAGAALHRRPRLVPVPAAALRSVARLLSWSDRLIVTPLRPASLLRLTAPLVVDGSRFADATGFRPASCPITALARTADWFLSHDRATADARR